MEPGGVGKKAAIHLLERSLERPPSTTASRRARTPPVAQMPFCEVVHPVPPGLIAASKTAK